ncbi:Glutamine amidotransferase [Candidatus Terasakiella magnetica]|nr:Glutamine amidotransferase [Candidatus Terasakiella magnetica]
MSQSPIIGITLDSEEPGGYSKMPWYALRKNYCESVVKAGGVPVLLPHEPALAAAYLDLIDGLIVTGGAFDVDPALFGAASRHATVVLKARRTEFELAVVKGALERDMPLLGICGGQQLMNVALGGTLIQHIPDEVADPLAHEQPNPRTEPGHDVAVAAGSKLAAIVGAARIPVNSAHHQAVKDVAPGCVADAFAPDGVVEGIEAPDRKFCIGVQWHPEYDISPADTALLRAFVEACR